MRLLKHPTIIYITTFLLMFQSCKSQETSHFVPTFTESKNSFFKIKEDQAYTFGYLKVLENRDKPNGRTIELPIYIFKSRHPNPKKDPIIYTVGGPGNSTMYSAQYMKYYKYLDDRDVILFEQRGTEFSKPHLDCPEWAEALYQSSLPDFDKQTSDQLLESAATACRERLKEQQIDLNQYHTTAIAEDINDLINALDIESYNLLTISYSTKIAQVLLRDHPKRIRSVVMDSPLPLEVNYDEESITNLVESVDKLFFDCKNDRDCNKAYPNLKTRFWTFLSETTKTPIELTVEHPNTKKEELFYLSGSDLISIVSSASTGDIYAVPSEINKLLCDDFSTIKYKLINLLQNKGSGSGIGMRLSVWCAEEYPFASQDAIYKESKAYPELIGLEPDVYSSTVCNIWSVKKVDDIENSPVKSDIPVLLINGEYDSQTPPKWAAQMQNNLSSSFHIIFKGWKHTPTTNWSNTCAMEMANQFFNDPTTKPIIPCFENITSPKFKVD